MIRRKGRLVILMSLLAIFLVGCNVELETSLEETIENGGAYKEEVSSSKEDSSSSKESEEKGEGSSVKDEDPEEAEIENGNKDDVSIETEDEKVKNDSDRDKSEVDEVDKETIEEEVETEDDISEDLKILSTHKMEAESLEFDEDMKLIANKVHELGGYISSNSITSKDKERRQLMQAELTLRIPRGYVNEIISTIDDNVTITSELLTSADITDKYFDIEARIENLENRENRLRELYERSDNVNDIIIIDDKLFEVTQDKEQMVRERLRMEDRVSLSRIDLSLSEVKRLSIESDSLSAKDKIVNSFTSTGGYIKSISVEVFIVVVKALPIALIVGAAIYIYRRVLRSYEEDKRKEFENRQIKKKSEDIHYDKDSKD